MKDYYTAGELAKLTGVSYKTIRYYLDKKLIKPEYVTDSGYRMYGRKTIETLQRIILLKYLDFSLDSVKEILKEEESLEIFKKQEELLQAQKTHLEQVILAVKEIQKVDENEKWEKMINIINMTARKEELIKQYQKSENLQKRINIHEFSTSDVDWYHWILERLKLKDGMKILDIGCGNGILWTNICEELPTDLKIFMTDNSEGMLNEARHRIKEFEKVFEKKNIRFTFLKKDAEEFAIDEKNFDRIMANHMLYHVSNEKRPDLFKTCSKLLAKDGMFFASTVGQNHFKQIFELIGNFDKRIELPNWMSENFELENGEKQLKKVFNKVFMEEQKNDLLVSSWEAVYEYIISLPGNAGGIIKERNKEFIRYLKANISEKYPYFIQKSAGVFLAQI